MGSGCPRCKNKVSKAEIEVAEYARSLLPNTEIRTSDRTVIQPKELDIYIPELKKAIEYNGTYFHGTKFKPADHREVKTALAAAVGIQLLHVEEVDWTEDRESLEGRIREFLAVG
jgi:hypothetical protein